MKSVELLAPAGDIERLRVAFAYGADAVYFGGQDYSLRANAHNFSIDQIKDAVVLAHQLHKRVYVTVNIVFHDKDLNGLEDYLLKLDKIKVDAIIVSDVVVMDLWKKLNLSMELHISTQASSLNYETVKFYKNLGATRVVLAREASRDDIKRIKDEMGIDLECFIHGAMCTSISGRCVLSNYSSNRDSNRGGCVQACRFSYKALNSDEIFSMTPKDLNMISNIEEMINIGVNSFKVEGRMRSIYYIATVIHSYRRIIDMVLSNKKDDKLFNYYLNILNRCANRDSTPQFFNGLPTKDEQYFLGREEVSNKDFLGIVLDYDKRSKMVTIEQRNYFKVGDKIEIFGPNKDAFTFIVPEMFDDKGEVVLVANHPQMIVKFKLDMEVEPLDMLRIKTFDIEDKI